MIDFVVCLVPEYFPHIRVSPLPLCSALKAFKQGGYFIVPYAKPDAGPPHKTITPPQSSKIPMLFAGVLKIIRP